jgi:exo-beta-1,3-glucanase (GH17 family)
MYGTAYLRHPLTLLAVVSLVVGFVWYLLGLPVQMPSSPFAAGDKIDCVAYAPASAGETDPAEIPLARIEADIAALARHVSCIRTYRTGLGLDRVVDVAAGHELKVMVGLTFGPDAAENRAEIERAVVLAEISRDTVRAFVAGDRTLSTRTLRASELTEIVRELRQRTKLPVTSAEFAEAWLAADQLAATADLILLRVPLYDARYPPTATDAAATVVAARDSVAAAYPGKSVVVEAGWPSTGRMREAAIPSASIQARVLHDLTSAARAGRFQLVLFEGIDNPSRAARMGTAAAHWGFLPSSSSPPKFSWGGAVENHPLWFTQGATGIMFALVVFAAGFLGARSAGPHAVERVKWGAVAAIALGASPFLGLAIADLPVQSHSVGEWLLGTAILIIAIVAPPVCAATAVRQLPFEGFGSLLDPSIRRHVHPLSRAAGTMFTLTIFVALALGVTLVFDPEGRELPFAPLTGPAVAFFILSLTCPPGLRNDSMAEKGAALILAMSAALIVFNESLWNWQAAWLAALLFALAWACRRAPAARNS